MMRSTPMLLAIVVPFLLIAQGAEQKLDLGKFVEQVVDSKEVWLVRFESPTRKVR
jgi:hypothetical protein